MPEQVASASTTILIDCVKGDERLCYCLISYHVITYGHEATMAEWTINGFKITMYKADHPPLHCHVRRDGKFVGKYDLEAGRWMTGPFRHRAQATAAIAKWRRQYGL